MFMLTSQDIRELRVFLEMTPTQLAYTAGVTENTVRRWEMGIRHPTYKHLEKLNDLMAQAIRRGHKYKSPLIEAAVAVAAAG